MDTLDFVWTELKFSVGSIVQYKSNLLLYLPDFPFGPLGPIGPVPPAGPGGAPLRTFPGSPLGPFSPSVPCVPLNPGGPGGPIRPGVPLSPANPGVLQNSFLSHNFLAVLTYFEEKYMHLQGFFLKKHGQIYRKRKQQDLYPGKPRSPLGPDSPGGPGWAGGHCKVSVFDYFGKNVFEDVFGRWADLLTRVISFCLCRNVLSTSAVLTPGPCLSRRSRRTISSLNFLQVYSAVKLNNKLLWKRHWFIRYSGILWIEPSYRAAKKFLDYGHHFYMWNFSRWHKIVPLLPVPL